MASTLLRRQLARVPRLPAAAHSLPSVLNAHRNFSTSPSVLQAEPETTGARTSTGKSVFDTHIVEDLHGMHASEILAESGTRKDAQMRHFTGEFLCTPEYRIVKD